MGDFVVGYWPNYFLCLHVVQLPYWGGGYHLGLRIASIHMYVCIYTYI
jgi:hypothetical protein